MCIGLPMQITETGIGRARCQGMGIERDVDTLLIGDHPIGTWVLVFINSAREVLSAERAAEVTRAVTALDTIMAGTHGSNTQDASALIDSLFSDLVNREPPKPPSLLALEQQRDKSQQHKATTGRKS